MYVSHNALETALVQSQVLPYIDGLRARGFEVYLVTFEPGPARRPRADWTPLPRRAGSNIADKAIDVLRGIATVVRLSWTARFVHARSYVPAIIAAAAGVITRRPFVFDMRGFLPDEYVDAGYWTERDFRYRLLRMAEGVLLRRAAEIVVLTEAAARRLQSESRFRAAAARPITVIPCTVDLERFRPAMERDEIPTLVYSGSVGSFYELDTMLMVYREARALIPALRMLILNRSEHDLIRSALRRLDLASANVVLRAETFSHMPSALARAHVGIALVRRAPSKLGSSAIKVAEYLACGLPVVVNSGLGDVDEQILRMGAGHVMMGYARSDVRVAAEAVQRLVADSSARERARMLAEREYDLAIGVYRYAALYTRMGSSTR